MQQPGSTIEEIRRALLDQAEKRFGKERAEELRPDIEQTAAELIRVLQHPMRFEDEP